MPNPPQALPTGTVTFLFTDIEGSTHLWQEKPEAMAISHARHDEILHEAIESNHGYIFQIVGDSFSAAFHNALDGLHAVCSAQRALEAEAWGETGAIKVRMGLHTGRAEVSSNGNYEGYTILASTQRVMSAAHGGQSLLTQTTCDLLQNALPGDITLHDMGEHRLKDLHAPLRLYQVNAPDLQQNFPAIKSLDTQPNNLPIQLTSFVGREKEIAEIKTSLNSSRLVTLTGSGGTGKTRLSIEVGAQELAHFTNGVWMIELAPLSDPAQIIPALAEVFGLQESPFNSLANLVTDYLRDKKLLLILDNCEHLIQGCARLADDLLHHCINLKILASSREALGIAGELAYHTPSLAEAESTRLFVERARAANPKFVLTNSNRSAIQQICGRLDGIPLAIELAAARTKLLSMEQIATHLDDMFRLLIGGSRTALPRQQTLRALIDWSYDLLSEDEQQLLRNASVFIGGWTLDALEAVADDPNTIEHLEGLVNKSLVATEERNDEMRYFMLETIRQYAREKLFEAKQSSAARDRHFIYFDELSEKMWDMFRSAYNEALANRLNDEVENFRAALDWGLEKHVEEAVRLAANFCTFLQWLGRSAEGVAFVQSAVERAQALPPAADESANTVRQKLIARALFTQGVAGTMLGNFPLAKRVLKEAIAISRVTGDKQILGYSLLYYFGTTTFVPAPDGDEAALEGFNIFTKEIDDRLGFSMAYLSSAMIATRRGDEIETQKYYGKLREMATDAPDSYLVGFLLVGLGLNESVQGHYTAAQQIFEDGLNLFQRVRNPDFQRIMQSELGHVARRVGSLNEAKAIYRETIRGWQNSGNRGAIANQLECFAFLAIAEEDPHRAAKLLGAAEALREKAQSQMTDQELAEYNKSLAQLRAMLAEVELNARWAEGRALTMEQAIKLALEVTTN